MKDKFLASIEVNNIGELDEIELIHFLKFHSNDGVNTIHISADSLGGDASAIFSEQFFSNLERIGKLINKYVGVLILDLYTKEGIPWLKNQSKIPWWKEGASVYCRDWENRVCFTLQDITWIPSLGNGLQHKHVDATKKVLENIWPKKHQFYKEKIQNGFFHDLRSDSSWKKWHNWQKVNGPSLDPAFYRWAMYDHVVAEVWPFRLAKSKIKAMGKDPTQIPVTPHAVFTTKREDKKISSEKSALKIFLPWSDAKDSGKFFMFFDKYPVLEISDCSSEHPGLILNEVSIKFFGKGLKSVGKWKEDLEETEVPPEPKPVKPDPPTPEPKPEPVDPVEVPEKNDQEVFMKNMWDFKGLIVLLWEKKIVHWVLILMTISFIAGAISC